MRRSVVLSWSKRWLIVTAILRPAAATLRAMRSDAAIVSAIGFSHRMSRPCASARSMIALVMLGRDDDGQKSAFVSANARTRIGVATLGRDAERIAPVRERRRIDVDQRGDLDRAVGDVALQELAAPALAEDADADVDDPLRHSTGTVLANDGRCNAVAYHSARRGQRAGSTDSGMRTGR